MYTQILPAEVNDIILSKLNADDTLIFSTFIGISHETIFKRKYQELYSKIKNIIDINVKFKNFRTKLYNIWTILYKDTDHLSIVNTYDYISAITKYGTLGYINPLSLDVLAMIDLYKHHPGMYKYVESYLVFPGGIEFFLWDIIESRDEQAFSEDIRNFIKTGNIKGGIFLDDSAFYEWEDYKILYNVIYITLRSNLIDKVTVSCKLFQNLITHFNGAGISTFGGLAHEEYLMEQKIWDSIIFYVSRNNKKLTIVDLPPSAES